MTEAVLTKDRLHYLVTYDPETGQFFLKNRFHRVLNGREIRGTGRGGYLRFKVDGRIYAAHRLAWLYMTGVWPDHTVDHIDLNKANNRWSNLRLADRSQQKANSAKRADSTSPYKGVYWGRRQKKWGASVTRNGRRHYLGFHATPEAAHAAYCAAAQRLFGEFARAA